MQPGTQLGHYEVVSALGKGVHGRSLASHQHEVGPSGRHQDPARRVRQRRREAKQPALLREGQGCWVCLSQWIPKRFSEDFE